MSKNLERVIQRAISDAAFRRQLQSNPEAALRGFNLTQGEIAALRSGDAGKLTSLGIDQRMSKTFTFSAAEGATRQAGTGDLGLGGSAALDGGATSAATRMVVPGYTGSASGVGDPGAAESTASRISDPANPASARGYVGGEAAPTSDALEDQSHSFATRNQGASTTASTINDPDNPASARGYVGGQTAPTSDALEDQSHSFAASRDQGASTTASTINDPDNPASARGYIGQTASSTSDAFEDQSHAFAATRSADVSGSDAASVTGGQVAGTDAFLTEGEVTRYSVDPNLSSDQAEDLSHTFNPDASTLVVDDADVADATSVQHRPDIPT